MPRKAEWALLRLCALASALACLCAVSEAAAQSYDEEEEPIVLYGYRDHTGVYSHIGFGVGFGTALGDYRYDAGPRDVVESGVTTLYHFALGASLIPRLALHFSVYGFDVYGSHFKHKLERSPGIDSRDVEAGANVTAMGLGTTYYFRSNLYVSAALGLGLVALVNEYDDVVRLNPGLASQASVGYEWWIGPSWGLGVALTGAQAFARRGSSSGDEHWNALASGLQFSATMN